MSTRRAAREVWVGLIVIAAVGGLIALGSMASDGPGFLAPQRTVDVVFRDAQGIAIGSSVRVAGLNTGNVVDVDLVEVEQTLRARVRISLPAALVKKLRQDVKISIVPALTGMSHVNVLSTGRSSVALVPGQLISGVETSLFDPILETVGLGPVERGHLSHTIAEVRETIDSIAPRIKHMLGSLQQTTTNLSELSDSIRPAVESTVNHVEDLSRKLNDSSPRIENVIKQTDEILVQAHGYMLDNRENVKQTLISVRDITASANDIILKDRSKVERVLDGLEVTRVRADRVLYQGEQIAGQLLNTIARSRSEVERSVTNIRDATDWVNKTVQRIYTNPFVLSPFYKPNHEDLRVQTVYSTALAFTQGAQELRDTVRTIEAMAARPATQQQQQELLELQRHANALASQLNDVSTKIAEGLNRSDSNGRGQRLR